MLIRGKIWGLGSKNTPGQAVHKSEANLVEHRRAVSTALTAHRHDDVATDWLDVQFNGTVS